MTLPLAGYRVLELAHLIAGPVCGMYLADMGADVVKIEQPSGGDASRTTYGTHFGGESAVFVTVNRNKRSAAIDLARPEGRAAFERLVTRADVVIEAYRGGVAERLGIDWASLAPLNPRLVYCSLSAFGPDGPWREKPGVDMLVQAMGGVMAVTGDPDGPPALCGAPVLDTIGSLMAGQGILTALLHRERTGQGQRVDVSLLNGALLAHAARLSVFLATGEEPGRWGSGHPYLVPFQAFQARDGWVYVAVWVDRLWTPFCEAIGRGDLAGDPRFVTRADRLGRRAELTALLADVFRAHTVGRVDGATGGARRALRPGEPLRRSAVGSPGGGQRHAGRAGAPAGRAAAHARHAHPIQPDPGGHPHPGSGAGRAHRRRC